MTMQSLPVDVTGLPEPQPAPQRPPALAALWIAIVAMLATSVFGLASFAGDDDAASPQDAVRQLLRAANDSDMLGAIDALLPSERDALRGPVVDLVAEAKRLGLLSESADPGNVAGLGVTFADVKMKTTTLADGIVTVTLTDGTVTSRVDPKKLPVGDLPESLGAGVGEQPPEVTTEQISDDPIDLVTVRDGDRWYVSIGYTVAESARTDKTKVPPFGHGVAPKGEATATEAAEAMLRAALALDVERLIAILDPGEARALQDYAPLFLADAKAAAADAASSFSATVNSLKTQLVKESGNRASVAIKSFDVGFKVDGKAGRVTFDGKCSVVSLPGEKPVSSCAADLAQLPFLPPGISPVDTSVAVVNTGGQWFISPVRTFTDSILAMTKQFDRASLEKFIKDIESSFDEQMTFEETGSSIGA
jgi:hypothetical protein